MRFYEAVIWYRRGDGELEAWNATSRQEPCDNFWLTVQRRVRELNRVKGFTVEWKPQIYYGTQDEIDRQKETDIHRRFN